MIEHIELAKRFNELQSQWLYLCRARYKRRAAIASWRKVRGRGGGAFWRCLKVLSASAGNPPMPRGVGPVIRPVRQGQQGDSVASRAYQIQPGW
jgi:hypothetical protein